MSSLAGQTITRCTFPRSLSSAISIHRWGLLQNYLGEPSGDLLRVGLELVVVVAAHPHRVVTAFADLPFDVGDLGLGFQHDMLGEHSGVPLVPPPDDWHHRLAGDVAAHDDDVRLIESAGVEELAPADLRAVNVGDVEDLERFLAHRDLPPRLFQMLQAAWRPSRTASSTVRGARQSPMPITWSPSSVSSSSKLPVL